MRSRLTWDFSYTAVAIRGQGGDISKVQSTEFCAQMKITLIVQNALLSINSYGRLLKIDFTQEVSFQK